MDINVCISSPDQILLALCCQRQVGATCEYSRSSHWGARTSMIVFPINVDDENKTSSLQLETRSDPRHPEWGQTPKSFYVSLMTAYLLPSGNMFTACVVRCGRETPRVLLKGRSEVQMGLSARLTSDKQLSSCTCCPKLILSDARVAARILTCRVCNL